MPEYEDEYEDGLVNDDNEFHEPAHPDWFDNPDDPWDWDEADIERLNTEDEEL